MRSRIGLLLCLAALGACAKRVSTDYDAIRNRAAGRQQDLERQQTPNP